MYLNLNTISIGSTAAADSTTYSGKALNGYLVAVQLSTGAAGSGILTSTGNLILKGEVSAITFASIPIGSPPWTAFVRTPPASSSGGIFSGGSTALWWPEKWPLANERLVVQTSGGSSGGAYYYTLKVFTEGSQI